MAQRPSPLCLALAAAAALLVAGCAQPDPKKPSAPPPEAESAVPRTGVVGLIVVNKERGLTRENWQDSVKSLFSNDTERNVIATRYDVTVFYDDGTSGVVTVDQKPGYQPGQRVRVVGTKIEPLRPR
jgi:type IV pilus biogenesis protein CpaD/CtpE